MKKTSIFLTSALIVMAILAGCSDTVAITGLPQNVKSGTINQIGDFLTEQTFDPKKFTVDITYDNGQVITDDGSVTVQLDIGNTVKRGSTVSANIGQNVDGIDVYATGSVAVYDINRIEVTGPAEIASDSTGKSVTVPASALTVTAYYLDSENAEQSMVLSSGEYKVEWDGFGTGVILSAAYPSQATTATVIPLVGQSKLPGAKEVTGTFSFTATYPTAAPEKEIVGITSVSWKEGSTLLALDYGTVPAPSFADVNVGVQYVDGTKESLKADPGITFKFVDHETGRDLTATKLTTDMELDVVATYGELTKRSATEEGVTPTAAKLRVTVVSENADGEFLPLVTGEAVGTADSADFIVDLGYGEEGSETWTYLDSADVEVIYVNGAAGTEAIDADAVVGTPSVADDIYALATYMGATGYTTAALEPATVDVVPVSITAEPATTGFTAIARQYYTTLPVDTTAATFVDAETVVVTDSEGEEIELEKEDITYKFSLTKDEYTPLAPEGYEADKTLGYDVLVDVDTIYVEVSYTDDASDVTVATYLPVELVTPRVETITLNREYDVTLEDTEEDTPLYNTGITWSVTTKNDNGYIDYEADIDTDVYGILVDNKEAKALPAKVDNATHTVSIYTLGTTEALKAFDVEIAAGVDYIPANQESRIKVAFPADYKNDLKVDGSLENAFGSYTDFVVSGYTSAKGETTEVVTVAAPIIPENQVADETTILNVPVTFTDATGTEKTVLKQIEVTALSYTADGTIDLSYPGHDEVNEKGNLYVGQQYYANRFEIEATVHGTDKNLKVVGFITESTYDPEDEEATKPVASVKPAAEDVDTVWYVVVSYTSEDGTVAYDVSNSYKVAADPATEEQP